jgi:hypothetical protein
MDGSKDAATSSQPGGPQSTDASALSGSVKQDDGHVPNHTRGLVQSKEIVAFILHFLSTSSNEALLGVFACLMVFTYIILGRVGLLLIGIVLGIILHASWDGTINGSTTDESGARKSGTRRELALEVSKRLLYWR